MGAASGLTSGSRGSTPDCPANPSGALYSSAAAAGSRMGGASAPVGAAVGVSGTGAGAGGVGSAATAAAANNGQASAAQSHRLAIRVPGMVRPS